MDNEKLIECVKSNDILYDQNNKYYGDNVKKDRVWEAIGRIVKHSGLESKKHWNKLRDAYRRGVKKKKMAKGGQGTNKQKKWKYEEEMSFLMPHMRERESITSVSVDLSQDITDDAKIDAISADSNNCFERKEHVAPTDLTPVKKHANNKINNENETTSLSLMKYILDEDKSQQTNEIDLFFKSMAGMVKKLSPFNKSLAKSRVFKIVSELEMEELSQQQLLQAPSISIQKEEVPWVSYSVSDSCSTMHPPPLVGTTSSTVCKITR